MSASRRERRVILHRISRRLHARLKAAALLRSATLRYAASYENPNYHAARTLRGSMPGGSGRISMQ
jgi:hypothetical protein